MSLLRKYIGPLIPVKLKQWMWRSFRVYLNLSRHLIRDFSKFKRFNLSKGQESVDVIARQLQMYSHILEKGLAMRDFRPFFGKDVVMGLCNYLEQSKGKQGIPPQIIVVAIAVIDSYLKKHDNLTGSNQELELIESVNKRLLGFQSDIEEQERMGGILRLNADDLIRKAQGLGAAIESRHSVRMYEDKSIAQKEIDDCVRIASRSPSACNLQPTRIYVFHDRGKIKDLLEVQSGARGFHTEVPLLFILTYEISLQVGPRSRMQGYTDTGLFAQSLMLALLEKGIGSCPLNWAQEIHTDLRLRKLGKIKDSENIVMLISAGKLPREFQCAASSRLPVQQRMTVDSRSN